MNKRDEIKYSSYSVVGVFDRDFKVLYADNPRLFRRLSAGSKKLLKKFRMQDGVSELTHEFQSEGINYKAFIKQLDNKSFVCKIFEELDTYEIYNEETLKCLDNFKKSTLNVQSMAKMIEDYTERTKYNDDIFHSYFKRMKLENQSLYADCHTIVNAFDDELNAEYIPFLEYFLRTWDAVQFATRKIKKVFNIYLDPIFPCVKIDYSKFELAFYNIVKLVLIYSISEIPPTIFVKTSDIDKMEVSCSFPYRKDYSIDNCDLEIRAVKHIFRKLGGHFEIYEDNGKLCIFGVLETRTSFNKDDIAKGRDIKFIATASELRKKLTSDRFIHIYENVKENDKKYFASDVKELSVSSEGEMAITEMLFSKVLLVDSD